MNETVNLPRRPRWPASWEWQQVSERLNAFMKAQQPDEVIAYIDEQLEQKQPTMAVWT